MTSRDSLSHAVAIKDGLIVAIGMPDVEAWKGRATEIVDLNGQFLLPGFQDAHIHPTAGGLAQLRCDLSGMHDRSEYLDAIGEYAKSNPSAPSIQGAGWYGDVFEDGFPDKSLLDAIEQHRPIVLNSHDGHGVWANSEALQRAGITRDTADPVGGRIHRDANGEPTGMLIERAADLVTDLLPPPTADDIEAALLQAQRYLHSLGITAWQDAAVGNALDMPDAFDTYRSLANRGMLTAKVTAALWWNHDADPEEQLARLLKRRAQGQIGNFQATAVKIMLDGVCENLTGSMLEPYRNQGDNRGLSFIEPEALRSVVADLDAEEFDVHIHAVGDCAVRDAVDSLSLVPRNHGDRRHQITHLDIIEEPDAIRMGDLGIIANLQPLWARLDPVLVSTKLPYLTREQQIHHFAFRTIRDAGSPLAFSSDWPVSSPDPLWGAHVAVNRTAPRTDPHALDKKSQTEPLLPDESVDTHDALAAYTIGAARANRLDDATGTLELGKSADIIVLDRDPYKTPSRELSDIEVQLTMVDGRAVYSKD
ncbi:amidohydrolase [Arthrobacter castelli]|uniref:amidohydrolase n=1 Tax=Arthrobacter castelli TaxID=271431 RepID=UPI001FE01FC2|nr:amidohydrolase [Arthrobacter castelli]